MTERIQNLFLELPNARHALEPGATVLEKFCYALHNMKNLDRMPDGFEGKLLEKLFESAEISKFAPQERTKYIYDMTTERDIKNQIAYAEKHGREEGLLRGREEGREESKEEIARLMLQDGMDMQRIQYTGLSMEVLEQLAR